jgi:hypothetical protein
VNKPLHPCVESLMALAYGTTEDASAEEWRGAYFALARIAKAKLDDIRKAALDDPYCCPNCESQRTGRE